MTMLLAFGAAATVAQAEVALDRPKAEPAQPVQVGGNGPDAGRQANSVGGEGDETTRASLRCYQGGKEVVSEADYSTVSLGEVASERTIRLGGSDTLFVVPFDESLCLVKLVKSRSADPDRSSKETPQ